MKIDLRKIVSPTIPVMALIFLIVLLLWASSFYIQKTVTLAGIEAEVTQQTSTWFQSNTIFISIIGLLITGLNAFLISQLSIRHSIIRVRSLMPVFLFLFLTASWHETHALLLSHVALSLILLSLFVIFGIYRDRNATEQIFLASLLISVCSLLFQPFLLFIPLFWVGLIYARSFSFRGLLASIMAVLVTWGLFAGSNYYFNADMSFTKSLTSSFSLGFPLLRRPINEIIYVIINFIIGMIGIVSVKSNLHQESIQTRSLLNFLILLSFCSFGLSMLLKDYYFIFLPISAMGFSFVLGHCFTLRKSKFFGYIFLIFIAVNLLYIVSNLYLHAL